MVEGKEHSFESEKRGNLRLRGVEDVVSFDEREVILRTLCGGMTVEGDGLHIRVLDLDEGRVDIEGRIDGVFYFDETQNQKRRFFGKG